jgi:Pyridine nucleotide-disulphide oxidoreductase
MLMRFDPFRDFDRLTQFTGIPALVDDVQPAVVAVVTDLGEASGRGTAGAGSASSACAVRSMHQRSRLPAVDRSARMVVGRPACRITRPRRAVPRGAWANSMSTRSRVAPAATSRARCGGDHEGPILRPRRDAGAMTRPRVVVVGAGFGGLAAARALAGTVVDVTIVDRNNFATFQPLLYQVATAGLSGVDVGGAGDVPPAGQRRLPPSHGRWGRLGPPAGRSG